MISNEVFISIFVGMGALMLFVMSRRQARTRRRYELSRSNARVVREIKRMSVYEPHKILERDD